MSSCAERNKGIVEEMLNHFQIPFSINGNAYEFTNQTIMEGRDKVSGVCPSYACISIEVLEEGLMITGKAPLRLPEIDEDKLLRMIAKSNYGNIRGGVIYDPDEKRLYHQMFCYVAPSGTGLTMGGLMFCVEAASSSVIKAYGKAITSSRKGEERSDKPDRSGSGSVDSSFLEEFRAWLEEHAEDQDEDED